MHDTNRVGLDRHSDNGGLKVATERTPAISGLIGSSPNFLTAIEQLETVASVDCAVLIRGETGTGKEVIARAIHDASARCQQRFVAINCAAIPASLIESELFGHERGAFTGALTNRIGRFESADGGTLFLDEIGELPIELQPKFLRVLQEQEFERLGSSQPTRVDVRIIAATNQNLEQMVAERRFRMDLYYRLNVFPISLPRLRERASDIRLLIDHFLRTIGGRYGKSIDHISDDVMAAILSYDWPGNIRELQNFIERSVILTGLVNTYSLRVRLPRLPVRGLKRRHYFNRADYVPIEFVQLISRDPILLMNTRTDCLNRIAGKEHRVHLEAQHVTTPTVFGIPVPSNLSCICLIQDRIKERLIRQPIEELINPETHDGVVRTLGEIGSLSLWSRQYLLAETIELGRFSAGSLPLFRRLHNPFLNNLTAEIPFIELLAKNRFVYQLKFGKRELVRQQLETNWVVGVSNGAAAKLGLKRTTLITKMRRLGISTGPAKPVRGASECDWDRSLESVAAPASV